MKIEEIHNALNQIYSHAEEFLEIAKEEFNDATLNSYQGHLIKINNELVYQKYFMPVVSISNLGDICFNLESVSLEFFVENSIFLNNTNIEKLLKYNVEIYDGDKSEEDIYIKGMSIEELKDKLNSIKTIGVSIDANNKNNEELISYFKEIMEIIYPL